MKLNLGSNDVRYEGFLNVDIRNIEAVDIVDDVYLLSSIEDESVEHIIAHNILEHFAQDRVQDVIKVWVQKLKKDGLYVATVGYPVGMPGSTNTIKILTPSEIEYYLNFKEKKNK